ncbi:MAG: hypothetical protein ACREGJ_03740 [Candidatus Saccharimonadales bacterium]
MLEVGSNFKRSNTKILLIVGGVIIALLAVLAGYFIWQYVNLRNNPNSVAEETTQRLVDKVSKVYAVPKDEQPTVAQVKDKEKLKDQAFFKNAEDGDYILIYTNAKTAILYREKDNKLINVGPIAITDEKDQNTQQQNDQKQQERSP